MSLWARPIAIALILTGWLAADARAAQELQFFDGTSISTNFSTSPPNNPTFLTSISSGTATYTGILSGTGGVTKLGPGTIILTNANTYTGATVVQLGILEIRGSINHPAMPLHLGVVSGEHATLRLFGGGAVTNSFARIGEVEGNTANASVTGAGSTWTNTGNFAIGNAGIGSLLVESGGTVTNTVGWIGLSGSGAGDVSVNGADSTWTNTEGLIIGREGFGRLTIQDGGLVSNVNSRVGESAGSTGQVTVSGTGSKWTNTGDLYIGNAGTGSMLVKSGGAVTSVGQSRIGDKLGGTGTATITGAGSSWVNSSDSLMVGNFGRGVLNILSGGTVSGTFALIGQAGSGEGHVTVTGVGSTWTNTEGVAIGGEGSATLTILSGGTVSSAFALIGQTGSGEGHVTVTGAGSTWTNTKGVAIGGEGSGTLTIQSSGLVSDTTGRVGDVAGSTGEVTVSGTGSKWTNTGDLYIGNAGTGSLLVQTGGTVTSVGRSRIGDQLGSTGTATITGADSSWVNSADALLVGNFGRGVLNILSGGLVSGMIGRVGESAGSTGEVTVSGTGSKWTNTGDLYIGNAGTGSLLVQSSGAVTSVGSSRIGDKVGGSGTVTIAGAGSSWVNSSGDILVGNFGTGTLNILSGGMVSNTFARMGDKIGSTGSATITGAGSRWTNTGHLYVGYSGTGALSIQDGAVVTSAGNSVIGYESTSGSTATVTGPGSSWEHNGELFIGYAGQGSLDLADGGMVSGQTLWLGFGSGSGGTFTLRGTPQKPAMLQVGQILKGDGTGFVTFNGGILRATSDQSNFLSGSLNVTVRSGGVFIDTNGYDIGSSASFAGIGNVGGRLIKTGAGTLTLSGDSGLGGISEVNGGRLAIGAGGYFSVLGFGVGRHGGTTGEVVVSGAGAILDAEDFFTVGDGPGSTGTLTVADGGLVRLRFSGAKLTIGWENSTGTLNLDTGGTLQVGGTNGIQKHTTAISNFNFAGGTLKSIQSNLTTALDMSLSGATSTVDTNGLAATLSGVLSGSGALTKSGAGTLTLSGANTYTGDTTVTAGRLLVNGSLAGSAAVSAGATLGGSGSIGGTAAIDGTLAPGNSAGLLTFGDDLTLGIGSFTNIELASLASFDQVSVDGILAYGGTLTISFLGGFSPQVGDSFQLFKDFDSQSGAFTGFAFPNPAYAADFNYATGTLHLTAVPEPSTCVLTGLVLAGFVFPRRRAKS
jgi:fibronectin-binding autotransporter adhesin